MPISPLPGSIEETLEMLAKADYIANIIRIEEERFLETIEGGLTRMNELLAGGATVIPGEEAFRLYDTFGFPVDLTTLIAEEYGASVDLAGFEAALDAQRKRSRDARVYRITSAGAEVLKRLRVSLAELQREVGARPLRIARPRARTFTSPKSRTRRESSRR